MEVHHHPEVEKKGLKEYLLEGLMIFIAVMMGFFAESLREHIADHEKENQYIASMIEDAATDTANINATLIFDEKKLEYLDTMATLCFNEHGSIGIDTNICHMFRKCIGHGEDVTPTERTMAQLNTGGMRLISKKTAVDSIVAYSYYGKKMLKQEDSYQHFLDLFAGKAMEVINWEYIPIKSAKNRSFDYRNARLLTADKAQIIQLGNSAKLLDGILAFYIIRMQEQKSHAINLINTLKKEYKIKEE